MKRRNIFTDISNAISGTGGQSEPYLNASITSNLKYAGLPEYIQEQKAQEKHVHKTRHKKIDKTPTINAVNKVVKTIGDVIKANIPKAETQISHDSYINSPDYQNRLAYQNSLNHTVSRPPPRPSNITHNTSHTHKKPSSKPTVITTPPPPVITTPPPVITTPAPVMPTPPAKGQGHTTHYDLKVPITKKVSNNEVAIYTPSTAITKVNKADEPILNSMSIRPSSLSNDPILNSMSIRVPDLNNTGAMTVYQPPTPQTINNMTPPSVLVPDNIDVDTVIRYLNKPRRRKGELNMQSLVNRANMAAMVAAHKGPI